MRKKLYNLVLERLSKSLHVSWLSILSGVLTGLLLLLGSQSSFVHADSSGTSGGTHYRLAVVKMSVILRDAPQAEAASNQLRERFLKREEALGYEQEAVQAAEQQLLDNRSSISEEELLKRESRLRVRRRELKRSREDLREEVRIAKDQALTGLQDVVADAIEAIRAREQIDIIFRESDYIVASRRVDITDDVLAYLQQRFDEAAPESVLAPSAMDVDVKGFE